MASQFNFIFKVKGKGNIIFSLLWQTFFSVLFFFFKFLALFLEGLLQGVVIFRYITCICMHGVDFTILFRQSGKTYTYTIQIQQRKIIHCLGTQFNISNFIHRRVFCIITLQSQWKNKIIHAIRIKQEKKRRLKIKTTISCCSVDKDTKIIYIGNKDHNILKLHPKIVMYFKIIFAVTN